MSCHNIKELRVLYVEDEEGIKELMAEVLADEFGLFETASNGIEGLQKLKEGHFDCVVTDIMMDGMDGLTFAQRIKEESDIPIILLTAYSEKEKLFKAIDIGVTKYLVKPFTPEKLVETICQIFQKLNKNKIDLKQGYIYNKDKSEILFQNSVTKLTKKEKKLLDLLLKNKKRVVSIEEIEKEVWSDGGFSENALRTLVKRLRKKIYKELIKNYSGLGYKIVLQ